MSSQRPRIALIVTSAQSLRLLDGAPEFYASRGWEVHVIAAGARADALDDRIHYHDVLMSRAPSVAGDILALAHWVRLLTRVKPDIMVSGTPKAALLSLVAGFIVRVPRRIYLLRGLRLETSTGMRRLLLGLAERVTTLCAHRVIAVSESLRSEYVRQRLAPSHKISVIGRGSSNGVTVNPQWDPHTTVTALAELGLNIDVPVVGFVGRVTPDKGVRDLLMAVALLQGRGMLVQLLVVGPEEPVGTLEVMCREAAINRRQIAWTGNVPDPYLYYPGMRVLCLPSAREGMPNVVLEAASVGVPAIVSNATGARDSVEDGHTGLVFRRGDVTALADALEVFVGDAAIAKAMGEAAREFVTREFAREVVWDRYERVFRSLFETIGKSNRVTFEIP